MNFSNYNFTVTERFIRYAKIDTQSDPLSPSCPSTEKQKNHSNTKKLKRYYCDDYNCRIYNQDFSTSSDDNDDDDDDDDYYYIIHINTDYIPLLLLLLYIIIRIIIFNCYNYYNNV